MDQLLSEGMGRQAGEGFPSARHRFAPRRHPPVAWALFSEALTEHRLLLCPSSGQRGSSSWGRAQGHCFFAGGSERGRASASWLLKSWELLLWAPGSSRGLPARSSKRSLPTVHRV